MKRLFVAIDFPSHINDQLIALCKGIQKAKWIKPGQIHLTLRFIGEVSDEQAELLKLPLQEVRVKPFNLQLKGTGTFPQDSTRRARVLWAGVDAEPGLAELAEKVDHAAKSAGLTLKEETFTAHVTLARFRNPPGKDLQIWQNTHRDFQARPQLVAKFHLWESHLTPDGATHTIIETYPLA